MAGKGGRLFDSLRDVLAAADRNDTGKPVRAITPPSNPKDSQVQQASAPMPLASTQAEAGGNGVTMSDEQTQPHQYTAQNAGQNAAGQSVSGQNAAGKIPSAAEAAREARGGTPNIPPVPPDGRERHVEFDSPPTTRVARAAETRAPAASAAPTQDDEPRTQMLRGKQQVQRGAFTQDPVVGWLVVVGGPGLGSYRPVFEGNNTLGRNSNQRIPIDFGDDAISAEEQCYVRYDSAGRSFLFVPNLAKANVVSVNEARPTGAVQLQAMDVITVGRTQLVFVPFCGSEFDWSDVEQAK